MLDSFEALQRMKGTQPQMRSEADPIIVIEKTKVKTLHGGVREWELVPYGPLEQSQVLFSTNNLQLWESLSVSDSPNFDIMRNFKLCKHVKSASRLYRRYRELGHKSLRKGIRDRYYNIRVATRQKRVSGPTVEVNNVNYFAQRELRDQMAQLEAHLQTLSELTSATIEVYETLQSQIQIGSG